MGGKKPKNTIIMTTPLPRNSFLDTPLLYVQKHDTASSSNPTLRSVAHQCFPFYQLLLVLENNYGQSRHHTQVHGHTDRAVIFQIEKKFEISPMLRVFSEIISVTCTVFLDNSTRIHLCQRRLCFPSAMTYFDLEFTFLLLRLQRGTI